jgi:hypothetical protein
MMIVALFLAWVALGALLAIAGVANAEARYRAWMASGRNGVFRILTGERRRRAWFRLIGFAMLLLLGATGLVPEDWRPISSTLAFLVIVLLMELDVASDWIDARKLDRH